MKDTDGALPRILFPDWYTTLSYAAGNWITVTQLANGSQQAAKSYLIQEVIDYLPPPSGSHSMTNVYRSPAAFSTLRLTLQCA